jgi:serine/threonine protein phosphatase PrpC
LSLSRGFGDYRYKEEVSSAYISARPEIRHFSRTDADLILLGSDGLWKNDTN